jgi:hypothetical protein
VKVRKEQKPGDYADPGWFKHPEGTVAHEWTGPIAEPARFKSDGGQSMPAQGRPAAREVKVQKPKPGGGHAH